MTRLVERGLADEPVAPDVVEQFGLRHDPVAVSDQVGEDVEHLRLDVLDRPATTQLETVGVDLAVAELVDRVRENYPDADM